MQAGDSFGHIAFLDGGVQPSTVTAMDSGELLALRRADLSLVLKRSPELMTRLLATMARTVRSLIERIDDSALLDVRGRLAKHLADLADKVGTPIAPNESVLRVMFSQQELGDMVQTNRKTISKCLRALEREGVIRRTNRFLVILDRERLRVLGEELGRHVPPKTTLRFHFDANVSGPDRKKLLDRFRREVEAWSGSGKVDGVLV